MQLDAGIKIFLNKHIAKDNISAILTKLRAQGFWALPANPAQWMLEFTLFSHFDQDLSENKNQISIEADTL